MSLFNSIAGAAANTVLLVNNTTIGLPDGSVVPCYAKIREIDMELQDAGAIHRQQIEVYYAGTQVAVGSVITNDNKRYKITLVNRYSSLLHYAEGILM